LGRGRRLSRTTSSRSPTLMRTIGGHAASEKVHSGSTRPEKQGSAVGRSAATRCTGTVRPATASAGAASAASKNVSGLERTRAAAPVRYAAPRSNWRRVSSGIILVPRRPQDGRSAAPKLSQTTVVGKKVHRRPIARTRLGRRSDIGHAATRCTGRLSPAITAAAGIRRGSPQAASWPCQHRSATSGPY